jgi:tetratricopeptide (TPR) repeat protein
LPSETDRTENDPLNESVDLPLDRKREILQREALLTRDHWTVLGLKPGASLEAVKAAYFEASRRFHPDRYYGKNLGSFLGRLERIFQRLSEAHEVLVEGLQSVPTGPAPSGRHGGEVDRQRAQERRDRLARHPYLARGARATALMAEAERQVAAAEPEKALGLLAKAQALGGHRVRSKAPALEAKASQQQNAQRAEEEMRKGRRAAETHDRAGAAEAYLRATALDPSRADAAYEAARWILRAHGMLAEARALAQRAVELQPEHVPSLLILADICVRMGMGSVARRHLEAVLARDPKNTEARALLRQLR